MGRVNQEGNLFNDIMLKAGIRAGIGRFVPADNHVLDPDSPFFLILEPAGAIDVLMPAVSELTRGLMFLIHNNSASAITLKTSGDAAFTTAIVLAANETTLVVCTGHATAALGWVAIGTASSA